MKRNKLIIGGLGLTAVAALAVVFNVVKSPVEAAYQRSGILEAEQSASAYQLWLQSKMIDYETGQVITPERLNEIMTAYSVRTKNLSVQWVEHGPDNIGGRTRAVLVDHTNEAIVWTGGVSGGLYKSLNGANTWSRVSNFPGNQMISSIAQDQAGNVYVATGSLYDGWDGNGLYVTPDGGQTWELVPGTGGFNRINRVVGTRFSNQIFFTSSAGLRSYTYGGSIASVPGYGGTGVRTLYISDDGQLLVASATNNRTWVSLDAGVSWEDRSGNSAGQIASSGFTRIEYAISKKKPNGSYNIYAATSSGNNQGQWVSNNSGETWHRHTPATGAGITNGVIDYRDQGTWNNVVSYDPTNVNRVIVGGIDLHEWQQVINDPPTGGWNKISIWQAAIQSPFYVHADNHYMTWDSNNKLYIGNDGGIGVSIDLANTFYPANRGYNVTQFFKIGYDRDGAVIGGTQDNGSLYNNHKNATWQEFRQVTGGDGFSAVISFYNPRVIITSSQYNRFYRSADGGQIFNLFTPIFPAAQAYQPVGGDGGHHPFHTMLFLAEYYDLNSQDSVTFIPQRSYNAGDVVKVPSLATGDTINFVTPNPIVYSDTLIFNPALTTTEYVVTDAISGNQYDLGVLSWTPFPTASGNYPPVIGDTITVDAPTGATMVVVQSVTPYSFYYGSNPVTSAVIPMGRDEFLIGIPWDTLRVQDPFQSWFVFSTTRNGGELWGTRDAMRLSVLNPRWVKLATNLGGAAVDVEFSEDLNHMFVNGGQFIGSTGDNRNGPIIRIDGLGGVYTSDPDFVNKLSVDNGATATTRTVVSSGSFYGIGIDPRNPNDLVAVQGFNGNVFRSSNALSASPNLTQVGSQGGVAFYDVVIDSENPQNLFAATFNGAAVSENGGATWTDVSHPDFAGTPSYHIMQSWRRWNEGNHRPGEVYLGTHGRGIWSTDAVLSVISNGNSPSAAIDSKKPKMSVYPNPSAAEATLLFELTNGGEGVIEFYNIAGRKMKAIEVSSLVKGENKVSFNAADLPQGAYIVRMVSGNEAYSTKFIRK
jgi:hypothetical protein